MAAAFCAPLADCLAPVMPPSVSPMMFPMNPKTKHPKRKDALPETHYADRVDIPTLLGSRKGI